MGRLEEHFVPDNRRRDQTTGFGTLIMYSLFRTYAKIVYLNSLKISTTSVFSTSPAPVPL